MSKKKSKISEKKEKISKETKKKNVSAEPLKKDSNAAPEGVKFRVTFLRGQLFRGAYREANHFIIVSEKEAQAYSARRNLLIEPCT